VDPTTALPKSVRRPALTLTLTLSLAKLTTRRGSAAVDGCNQALLAKAAEAKLLRASRLRADTTVVPADVAYPDRLGAAGQGGAPERRHRPGIQTAGGATRTRLRDHSRADLPSSPASPGNERA
jgi:transposase, IS5 family